eukprot:8616050-Pyramimonas_sp.AAC.1
MRLTSSIPALGKHVAYQLRDLGYVYVEALEVLGIEVSGRQVRYSRLRQRVTGYGQSSTALYLSAQSWSSPQ